MQSLITSTADPNRGDITASQPDTVVDLNSAIEAKDSRAKCLNNRQRADGSQYGSRAPQLLHRPSRAGNSKKYIFWLNGGGWCTSASNCQTKGDVDPRKGDANSDAGADMQGGMLGDRCTNTADGNPLFCDWGTFQLEYCDYSSYLSDRNSQSNGMFFRGKANVETAFKVALDTIWTRHVADSTASGRRLSEVSAFDGVILLSGNSAGGVGILANADDLKAIMLADSRFGSSTTIKLQAHSAPFFTLDGSGATSDPFGDLIGDMITTHGFTTAGDCPYSGSQLHWCWRPDKQFPQVTSFDHDDKMLVFSDKDNWMHFVGWAGSGVSDTSHSGYQSFMQTKTAELNAAAISAGKRENVLYYTGIQHAGEDMWVIDDAGLQSAGWQDTDKTTRYRYVDNGGVGRGGMQLQGMADASKSLPLEEYTFLWVHGFLAGGTASETTSYPEEGCVETTTSISPAGGGNMVVTVTSAAETWSSQFTVSDSEATALGTTCIPSPPSSPAPPAPPPLSFYGLWKYEYNGNPAETSQGGYIGVEDGNEVPFYVRFTCDLTWTIYTSLANAQSDTSDWRSNVYPRGHGYCNAICEGSHLSDYQYCVRFLFATDETGRTFDWNECFKLEADGSGDPVLTVYSNAGPWTFLSDCSNCITTDDGPVIRRVDASLVPGQQDTCSVGNPDMRTASPPPLPPHAEGECVVIDTDYIVDYPWNSYPDGNPLVPEKVADVAADDPPWTTDANEYGCTHPLHNGATGTQAYYAINGQFSSSRVSPLVIGGTATNCEQANSNCRGALSNPTTHANQVALQAGFYHVWLHAFDLYSATSNTDNHFKFMPFWEPPLVYMAPDDVIYGEGGLDFSTAVECQQDFSVGGFVSDESQRYDCPVVAGKGVIVAVASVPDIPLCIGHARICSGIQGPISPPSPPTLPPPYPFPPFNYLKCYDLFSGSGGAVALPPAGPAFLTSTANLVDGDLTTHFCAGNHANNGGVVDGMDTAIGGAIALSIDLTQMAAFGQGVDAVFLLKITGYHGATNIITPFRVFMRTSTDLTNTDTSQECEAYAGNTNEPPASAAAADREYHARCQRSATHTFIVIQRAAATFDSLCISELEVCADAEYPRPPSPPPKPPDPPIPPPPAPATPVQSCYTDSGTAVQLVTNHAIEAEPASINGLDPDHLFLETAPAFACTSTVGTEYPQFSFLVYNGPGGSMNADEVMIKIYSVTPADTDVATDNGDYLTPFDVWAVAAADKLTPDSGTECQYEAGNNLEMNSVAPADKHYVVRRDRLPCFSHAPVSRAAARAGAPASAPTT